MKEKKCPLCYEEVFSEVGKGCKMCGMPLEDKSRDFCSRKCRILYHNLNGLKILKVFLMLIAFFGLVSSVSAQQEYYGCGMYGWYGNSAVGGYFGMAMQVLIIVALVLVVVWITKQISGGKR